MNILEEIANKTKERVKEKQKTFPLERLVESIEEEQRQCISFADALDGEGISFICEVKKASPSKGLIAQEYPYLQIAHDYEAAGAAAISVLTEPYYFQGEDRHLKEIAQYVSVPLLRKDFVVDPYMLYEAKWLGASAVLLICTLLDSSELERYLAITHELGLSALVEVHHEQEVEQALRAGARIIGVNNRDLKTFEVDLRTSARLRPLVPEDRIFVSESGIGSADDVAWLSGIGVDAVLIGESLMRSPDKGSLLGQLKGDLRETK